MAPNEWDDFASGWDTNDDVRAYAKKAFRSWGQKVAPLLSEPSKSKVLDFGCGTGLLTEKLAPLCGQILAVDTSARMIGVLRRKVLDAGIDNITALQGTVDVATINNNRHFATKFDLIVASSVCSFLRDYEATLCDLVSIMNPGGCFVQWDWLADMPVKRIRSAFGNSGLIDHGIEEAFAMKAEEESMQVVVGIGRLSF